MHVVRSGMGLRVRETKCALFFMLGEFCFGKDVGNWMAVGG